MDGIDQDRVISQPNPPAANSNGNSRVAASSAVATRTASASRSRDGLIGTKVGHVSEHPAGKTSRQTLLHWQSPPLAAHEQEDPQEQGIIVSLISLRGFPDWRSR